VGAAVGAVIAGPVGAVAGGLVASQAASHSAHREKREKSPADTQSEGDDPIFHVEVKRILVPLDFSKPSLQALRFARVWAARFGSELCLLHVIEPAAAYAAFESELAAPVLSTNLREQIHAQLEKLAQEEPMDSMKVSVQVREGIAYDQIAAIAREVGSDLIIIATHGHTALSRALLGSTVERVVRHAPCPVLTLRCAERASGGTNHLCD